MPDINTGLGVTIFGDGYTGDSGQADLVAVVINNALKVDNSSVIQPVSGTIFSSNLTTDNTKVVSEYGEVNSVAPYSSGDIYYTLAPSTTLYLKGIMASSSGGPCKVVVDYGVLDAGNIIDATTIATGFYSSAVPYILMEFVQAEIITSTLDPYGIRVRITNNNPNSQNVYAKIMGQKE
jgi:hypothetical protein